MQKYSSNVVEKCLGSEDECILKLFVNKVCIKNSVLGIFILLFFRFDEK